MLVVTVEKTDKAVRRDADWESRREMKAAACENLEMEKQRASAAEGRM